MSINQKLSRLGKKFGADATTKNHATLPPVKPTAKHQLECKDVTVGPPRQSCKHCHGTGDVGMYVLGVDAKGEKVYGKLLCACRNKPPVGMQKRRKEP